GAYDLEDREIGIELGDLGEHRLGDGGEFLPGRWWDRRLRPPPRRRADRNHRPCRDHRRARSGAGAGDRLGAGRRVAPQFGNRHRRGVARHRRLCRGRYAAGPFQGADYRLTHAAIAARVHYLNLADARDFVAGFTELDGAAREAGVVALTLQV